MSSRYVLYQNDKGDYYFTLVTHSGQVLLSSAVYADKESARRAITLTQRLAHNIRNFEISSEAEGESSFLIKSRKGEVLAESEIFPDAESLKSGINLVKGNTRGARLEDTTVPLPLQRIRNGKAY